MDRDNKLLKHIEFCGHNDNKSSQSGSEAEVDTAFFLAENLNPLSVGDFRILVNYNMPLSGGQVGTLEIDLVLINKFGVFLLEVKDWWGVIEAYDDSWRQNRERERGNVFSTLAYKAKVFHASWFGNYASKLQNLNGISVTGLIVLAQGKKNFFNYSNYDDRVVIGLGPSLADAVSSVMLLHGSKNKFLSDVDIERIRETIFKSNLVYRERIIRNYRIINELSSGDLFDAFEAVNINVENQRIRIKRYHLGNLSNQFRREDFKIFKQSTKALSKMGSHPNLVSTFDYFLDEKRPNDTSYEITEVIDGKRLDEIISEISKPLSLKEQLEYIKPLSLALKHAHKHKIYHRNITPKTIYVTEDNTVKLADFDFAKIVGEETIYKPILDFTITSMTAPELKINYSAASPASDIYSLGVLWFFLACLPDKKPVLTFEKIETLDLPPQARQLIKEMVTEIIAKRPKNIEYVLDQINLLTKDV